MIGVNTSKRIFIVILVFCFVLAGAVFLLPSFGNTDPIMVHTRAAVAMLAAALGCSAAVWFMSGLSGFKPSLRNAYRWLGIGIGMFALSLLQLPVVGVFNLWNVWYVNSGMLIVPFVLSSVIIYVGMRKFVRLLGIKTWMASWRFVAPGMVVFAVLCGLVTRPLARYPFDGIETYIATVGWSLGYLAMSAVLAWMVYRMINTEYKSAMKWLTIGIGAYAVAALHEVLINVLLDSYGAYFNWGYSLIGFVIAGGLCLEAGRRFYLLTLPYGKPAAPADTPVTDQDYVDSIVAAAGLASRISDIDPILEDLRLITATHAAMHLTNPERQRLLAVYHKLETYLVTNEPLRNLTRDNVRQRTRPAFQAVLSEIKT